MDGTSKNGDGIDNNRERLGEAYKKLDEYVDIN
jgi:hypothetical protein